MRSPKNRWKVVPGIRTSAAPAPITFADHLHLFVRSPEGTITWNRFQPQVGWAEWAPVPGVLPEAGPPFVVPEADHLQLMVLDPDGGCHESRYVAGDWAGWRVLPSSEPLRHGPRAAVWAGELHRFALDGSGSLLWQQGRSGWEALPGLRALCAPHPVLLGGQLHLFLVGPDGELQVANLPPDGNWSSPLLVPGAPQTERPPWAIRQRSTLLLATVDRQGEIWLARRRALSGWAGWQRVRAPFPCCQVSLCPGTERCLLFAAATDSRIYFTAIR